MKKHVHNWKKTGKAHYTCPLEYEEKCECGKIRWVEGEGTPHLTLTEEQMRARYPQLYKD